MLHLSAHFARISKFLKGFLITFLCVSVVCTYSISVSSFSNLNKNYPDKDYSVPHPKYRQTPQWRIVEVINESLHIELSCARDFSINDQMFRELHSPMRLTVMRQPKNNVQCFARCLMERYSFYLYEKHDFDVERLVEVGTAIGLTENHTRYNARRCKRIAWQGDEDCEDFWNIFRCFQGSV